MLTGRRQAPRRGWHAKIHLRWLCIVTKQFSGSIDLFLCLFLSLYLAQMLVCMCVSVCLNVSILIVTHIRDKIVAVMLHTISTKYTHTHTQTLFAESIFDSSSELSKY